MDTFLSYLISIGMFLVAQVVFSAVHYDMSYKTCVKTYNMSQAECDALHSTFGVSNSNVMKYRELKGVLNNED